MVDGLQAVRDVVRFDYDAGSPLDDPLVNPRIARFEAKFRIHRKPEKRAVELVDHAAVGDYGYGAVLLIFRDQL